MHVAGQHRPARLFQLQEQHVVGAAALQQGDVGAQPDAADADHLVGDVDQRVAAQGPAPVRGQGGQVLIEPAGELVGLGVVDPGQQRRVFGDPALPVAFAGEPGQRPVAGPAARLRRGPLDLGPQRLARHAVLQVADVDPLVGPGQQRHRGQVADLGAVSGHAPQDRRFALLLAGAVLPARDPDARHQAPQIPLPRAGVRLVEVVQVDDQIPLRGGVEAEVPQVRVTADHRGDAGGRQPGSIRRHHHRRTAQESVRRGGHPPDPHRDQPAEPAVMRLDDQLHRIGPAAIRGPLSQRAARNLPPQLPAYLVPVTPRRRPPPQRGEGVTVGGSEHDMPARGISRTGLLRHGLKASSPVERLITCSPGQGPMMPSMPGSRGRGWPPRSVVIISRARRGTGCRVCHGLGALGRRRYAPTAKHGTSGSANAVRLSATAILARPPTPPVGHPVGPPPNRPILAG